ncbi:MAG TPA: DEAD/DEAH box helicase [Phnomibacter sp.]|nr:DEAD/DEAH box helicase [Phnomibacter sp.]
MKFEKYPLLPAIKANLDALGFKRPTDIQYKAIASIMKGEDVLAIAQTGTGKTAAFAIPIVHYIATSRRRVDGIRALIMVPTRELAMQIHEVFCSIAKGTQVQVMAVVGGVEQDKQINKLQAGIDILIATPGRMFDLIAQQHLDIGGCEILVLDEADRMMALGFMRDIKDVKRRLPREHQTLFFSATINEEIKDLAYSLVRNPIRIQVSPQNTVSKNVTHTVAMIEMDDKRFFLERTIRQSPDSKILVFVRTKVRAERVQAAMQRVELNTAVIHGDKEQDQRFDALKQFAEGKVKVLITTDVSARGIDIKNVEYVINYDIPDIAENYVHRVGRTGRGMEKGYALSFCSAEEIPLLKEVEKFIGGPIDVLEIPKGDYKDMIDFSAETKTDLKAVQKMIAENEAFQKTKKTKKK